MHIPKNEQLLARFWRTLMFYLYIIQINPVTSEAFQPILLANGEERTRPLVSEIHSTLTLNCSMRYMNVNITNDKGQILNSSFGVVSFVLNSTTCQDAGTYICQAPGVAEKRMILFIDGCHPVLCEYKQQETIITAKLSTDAHVSICFLFNKERPQNLVMLYNKRWIRQDASDDKVKFYVIRNTTDFLYSTLSITIRNITVNDYGEVDIALPVAEFQVLKCRIYISNEGNPAVHFQHTSTDNEHDLACIAYNYPKKVSIRKKTLNQVSSESIIENTWIKPYLKLRFPANTFSCDDMGIYECDVTPFQGKTRTYEYVLLIIGCSAVLKLCNWQPPFITTKTHIGGRVHLEVCIFNTFENIPVGNITQSPMNSFNYSINRIEMYTTIGLTISDIKETDFRNYTIHIGNSVKVTVNMVKSTGLGFCHTVSERFIHIRPNERAIFSLCVKTNETVNISILINNVPVSTNGTTHQYRVMVDTISKEEIYFTIEILNFTTFSVAMYNVQIFTKSGSTISHRVFFNITETFIHLCEGEHDNITVTVRLYSPAVVHLCVSSNVGLGEYISIDRVPHQIYGPNRASKYGVSADVINQERQNNYYIQIYIHNVTKEDIGTHEIMIKPTRYKYETFIFSLQQSSSNPRLCETDTLNKHYMVSAGEDFMLPICLHTHCHVNVTFLLNGIVLSSEKTSKYRYDFVGCDNTNMEYNVTITIRAISLQDFVNYNLTIIHRGIVTVNTTLSFSIQEIKTYWKISDVIILIVSISIVSLGLISTSLFCIRRASGCRKEASSKQIRNSDNVLYEEVDGEVIEFRLDTVEHLQQPTASTEIRNNSIAPLSSLHFRNISPQVACPPPDYINVRQNEYDEIKCPDGTDLNVYAMFQAVPWDDVYISLVEENGANENAYITLIDAESFSVHALCESTDN